MKRNKMRTAVLLLSIAGMTLCLAGCQISKAEKEAEKQRRFDLKQEKQKEKHRGR